MSAFAVNTVIDLKTAFISDWKLGPIKAICSLSHKAVSALHSNHDEDGHYDSDDTYSLLSQPGSDHSDQSLDLSDINDDFN